MSGPSQFESTGSQNVPWIPNVYDLGPKLRNAAQWDLLAACMEYEYADLVAPKFYDRLAGFYLAGRLPRGWQGEYPQGKLEIYSCGFAATRGCLASCAPRSK